VDLLGDDLSFALLVLFGMFAVGVHSYNLYGKRIPEGDTAEKHHFLDSLSLQTLGGRHFYIRGFIFYLVVNELIYLTLAFSSLILQQSLQLIDQEDMVGALTADIGINPLYPILASTVIIVASQMKPLADVENALRRMAHAIAGIPRTLFDVQQRIKALTINDLLESETGDPSGLHELVENAAAHASTMGEAAGRAGMAADELSTLKKSLQKMHCLYGWTLGYHGEKIWIDERTMPISAFFQSMRIEKRTLSETMESLLNAEHVEPTPTPRPLETPLDQWRSVALRCRDLENKLSDVLGLMLINKPDADLTSFPTLRKLRNRVNLRDVNPETNAFGLAAIQGWGIAIVMVFVYLILEKSAKNLFRTVGTDVNAVLEHPILPTAIEPELFEFTEVWQDAFERTLVTHAGTAGEFINRSIAEVIEPALIFIISVGIALSMRALHRINRRWPERIVHLVPKVEISETGTDPEAEPKQTKIRSIKPPSVTTYLYVGACAYLLSCAAILSYRYIVMVIAPALESSLSFKEAALLVEFSTFIPEIFLICASAFVCAWFACSYLDLESWSEASWVHRSAFTMALLCASLNLAVALSTTTVFTGWDLIGAFASPYLTFAAFFVRYARLIERYQTPEPAQAGLFEALLNWYRQRTDKQNRSNPNRVDQNAPSPDRVRRTLKRRGGVTS